MNSQKVVTPLKTGVQDIGGSLNSAPIGT